jgi:hypothetical protein
LDHAAAQRFNEGDAMINHHSLNEPKRKERCETCHFQMVGQRGWFECHRIEPQITIRKECDDEAIMPVTMWPIVSLHDWCGQYSPKKKGA